jgi:ABC-2 type transport system ATP-binding protein
MTTRPDPRGGIILSRLSKSYGAVRAVRSIDLTIAAGETVALLGPNGAGKSTTIDMVLGLTRSDSGHVTIFGQPPAQAVAAGQVSGMLQVGSLIENLSVREFVTLVASLYPHPLPVPEVLELTGAASASSVVTPIDGIFSASASPRAAETPTRRPVKEPGPMETAMAPRPA